MPNPHSALPRTITAAAPLLRRGELTPVDLVEACFARIDRHEPKVHAWAYLDRDRALADAKRLTDELQRGEDRGPLHGIPVGIKDIIDVYDMPTGCGSKLWANSYARKDATCVARLRQAGAIILGKTVTTPFAFLDPPPTRNPWNLDRTPGGSSSGSAAAVACGMCFAALGTQTGGSVTRPASFCGVYSIKPTHGRINTDGVLPFAPTLDTVGVMANSVPDLAHVYQAVAGPSSVIEDCAREIESPADLGTQRQIGIKRLRGIFDTLAEPVMKAALDQLCLGSSIVPPPGFSEVHARHRVIMVVEGASVHESRFRRHPDDYPPMIAALIEEGMRIPAVEYRRALEFRQSFQNDMPASRDLTILATPAAPGPAPDPSTTGNAVCNAPWTFLGMPTVSLPFAWTPDGLPLAIQLTGWWNGESKLLGEAAALESRLGFEHRTLPIE